MIFSLKTGSKASGTYCNEKPEKSIENSNYKNEDFKIPRGSQALYSIRICKRFNARKKFTFKSRKKTIFLDEPAYFRALKYFIKFSLSRKRSNLTACIFKLFAKGKKPDEDGRQHTRRVAINKNISLTIFPTSPITGSQTKTQKIYNVC